MDPTEKEEIRKRFIDMAMSLEEPPPCSGCGRCVLAGPPCCEVKAEENRVAYKAWLASPEYVEYLKDEKVRTQAAKAAKAATKAAKRARREARKAAKL